MTLRNRLSFAIADSKKYHGRNLRQLSTDAGCSTGFISNLLNNETIDTSPTGPGIFRMSAIADQLGVSLDWLAGRASNPQPAGGGATYKIHPLETAIEAAARDISTGAAQFAQDSAAPSIDAFLRCYHVGGGTLEAFEPLADYFDTYYSVKPTDKHLSVHKVGAKSLAALNIGSTNPRDLEQSTLSAHSDLYRALIDDHLTAQKRGTLTTTQSLNAQLHNMPKRIRLDYIRSIAHVTNRGGEKFNLVFATKFL